MRSVTLSQANKNYWGSMSTTTTEPEIDGLKAHLKETWTAGDYDRFSRYTEQGARIFYDRVRAADDLCLGRRGIAGGMRPPPAAAAEDRRSITSHGCPF